MFEVLSCALRAAPHHRTIQRCACLCAMLLMIMMAFGSVSVQAQDWPPPPKGVELNGLSIPLIDRGRSRGIIRLDIWLEIARPSVMARITSNETRVRNSLIQVVGTAMHARPSTSRDIDIDFIGEQLQAELNRLFGEGQVLRVYFNRVIIRNR